MSSRSASKALSIELQAKIDQAMDHHRSGNISAARGLYDQVLEAAPGHAPAWNMAAILSYQCGDVSGGVTALRRALDLDPEYAEAHSNLGNMLRRLGEGEEARACYRRAIELKPDYADAYNNLGNALQEVHEYSEAVDCYSKVLALREGDPKAHNNLANSYQKQGRLDDAVSHYRQALALNPAFAEACCNLGHTLFRLRQHDAAAAQLRQAISLAPSLAHAHYSLGTVLKEQGKTEEAKEAFQTTLALEPEHVAAQHLLDSLSGTTSAGAPRQYIEELYDDFAETFDAVLVDELAYDVPKRLLDLLLEHKPELCTKEPSARVMDLGCGTGLSGFVLRDLAKALHGVDLSARMLEKAENRGVYDILTCGEIIEVLTAGNETYDLVVASDVLIYFGDMEALFTAVRGCLHDGGQFLFSVEAGDDHLYDLTETGRYRHSLAYLEDLGHRHGLELTLHRTEQGRRERGAPVNQHLVLMTALC